MKCHYLVINLCFYSNQEKQGSSTPMKDTKRRSQLLLTIEKVKFCYVCMMDDNTFNGMYDKILDHDWFPGMYFWLSSDSYLSTTFCNWIPTPLAHQQLCVL